MATSPHTRLVSFAEFERLSHPAEGRYELHHGELTTVAPPKLKHSVVQQKLRDLIQKTAAGIGHTFIELGFRALPEGEFRYADVAWISDKRWSSQNLDRYFQGVPDLVIEVLSPSNTAAEMLDKERLCLENGCQEFWIVDIDRQQVKISTFKKGAVWYGTGDEIPLFFSAAKFAVDALFR